MSAAAVPFPLPGARLAATLAEDAPYGDLTTQGLGIGDADGVNEGDAAVTYAVAGAVAMAFDGT